MPACLPLFLFKRFFISNLNSMCTHTFSRNQWKHALYVQFPQSDTLDIGHRDAVAVKPCRLFRTRDLCSSPLQHGTIVPCVN